MRLSCLPVEKMFMSVDYYYYIKNHVDSYTVTYALNNQNFDSKEKNLGQQLDFKAVYLHSDQMKSEVFAGWHESTEAYSAPDDTKTFEIRGEIVVNF